MGDSKNSMQGAYNAWVIVLDIIETMLIIGCLIVLMTYIVQIGKQIRGLLQNILR